MPKIVAAALKANAKTWTFEAKASARSQGQGHKIWPRC